VEFPQQPLPILAGVRLKQQPHRHAFGNGFQPSQVERPQRWLEVIEQHITTLKIIRPAPIAAGGGQGMAPLQSQPGGASQVLSEEWSQFPGGGGTSHQGHGHGGPPGQLAQLLQQLLSLPPGAAPFVGFQSLQLLQNPLAALEPALHAARQLSTDARAAMGEKPPAPGQHPEAEQRAPIGGGDVMQAVQGHRPPHQHQSRPQPGDAEGSQRPGSEPAHSQWIVCSLLLGWRRDRLGSELGHDSGRLRPSFSSSDRGQPSTPGRLTPAGWLWGNTIGLGQVPIGWCHPFHAYTGPPSDAGIYSPMVT
jgi:hypothetical protein